jgi:hypothetical protein
VFARGAALITEWKMVGQQDYVVGVEPGINIPEGRVNARKHGRRATLNLGQARSIHLEIVVLCDREDIDRLAAKV